MRDKGDIRVIKLGVSEDDYGIVLSEDYGTYIASVLGENVLGRKVMKSLIQRYHDVSLNKEQLMTELKFTNEEIS